MRAEKLMRLEVVTVPPDLSLEAAHKLMLDRGLRHLPVVSGEALAGIVSDRDILLAIGKDRDRFVYPQRTVGEVMSLAPISAEPNVPVGELAKTMAESKIDCLPIITRTNQLVGLVTATDLLLLLAELPHEHQPELSFQVRRAADLAARA